MELTKEQEEYVRENCKAVDLEDMYNDMLDECYGPVQIGNLEYSTSWVLQNIDPTAYRCGMVDYEDFMGLVEIDGEYYMPEDVEEALEDYEDLQEALEELADLQEEEEDERRKHNNQ